MAQTVNVIVCPEDRERLLAIIGDRNRPFKQIQRAKIVLFSAERLPVLEVARRAGASRPAVWRWQRRYGEQGVDGLLRDKTRKPGRAPLSAKVVAKVLELTCSEPPGEVTHWTGRAMAKARRHIASRRPAPVENGKIYHGINALYGFSTWGLDS
jgi:transposase